MSSINSPIASAAGFLVGFFVASFGATVFWALAVQIEEPEASEPEPVDECGPEWRTVPTPRAAAPGTVCCVYASQQRAQDPRWIGPVCFQKELGGTGG